MDYTLKRSKRKSIGLEIKDGQLIVRAPMTATNAEIEKVISGHKSWIDKKIAQQKRIRAQAAIKGTLSADDIRKLADDARGYIPKRVHLYAEMLGVRPGKITIRNQKTRWGSCSAKGNLNFNCLLMLTPPEVIDSVVVHELCHLLELNHSAEFYEHVRKIYPDYDRHNAWLKKHGPEIMARAHG